VWHGHCQPITSPGKSTSEDAIASQLPSPSIQQEETWLDGTISAAPPAYQAPRHDTG
jgi:hypothetical protein